MGSNVTMKNHISPFFVICLRGTRPLVAADYRQSYSIHYMYHRPHSMHIDAKRAESRTPTYPHFTIERAIRQYPFFLI